MITFIKEIVSLQIMENLDSEYFDLKTNASAVGIIPINPEVLSTMLILQDLLVLFQQHWH